MPDLTRRTARDTAREVFGWESLRDGQEEAMLAALEGRDVLVVMPTGAGKSACYQVPALLLDGPTVVVSPLIALQRDQVTALVARAGAGGAVQANSALPPSARAAALEAVRAGDAEFLFLAPEQLAREDVLDAVAQARPSLLVVDEAHCISSWGHDFRPDYLQLGAVVERLGSPTVMALTATASPPVREEIVDRLGLRDPVQVVKGFDRPGLLLTVAREDDDGRRREAVVLRAMSLPKPGLVYTATRRSAEDYAAALAGLGADAAAYHAGLPAAARSAVQERFMAGALDVVVATSAFGMGIDKADVRFVLHAEVPDSLDSLYQEMGRAGRDGESAEAVLLYRPADLGLRRFFASGAVDPKALRRAAVLLDHAPGPVGATDLAGQLGITRPRASRLLELLEQAGAARRDGRGRVTPTGLPPERAAELAAEVDERHHRADLTRVDMVRAYAETQGCRRQLLLGYFGERLDELCGRCDTCLSGTAQPAPDQDDSPYPLESTVRHAGWGRGRVMRFEEGRVVVLFEQEGYRTLSLDAVLAGGLLTLEEP